jgi:Flp pilus assembly protein TadG
MKRTEKSLCLRSGRPVAARDPGASGDRGAAPFRRSRPRQRGGAAAVEFAFVAPVLFMLVFGMIEFGRMVMVQQVLTNASREGCRVGILDGSSSSDVTTTVNNYLTSANINTATITIDPADPSSAGAGDSVTVTVSVDFEDVTWLPTAWFLGNQTLTAATVMRRETTE